MKTRSLSLGLLLAVLAALSTTLGLATPVHAANDGSLVTWGVRTAPQKGTPQRPHYSYQLKAGQRLRDAMLVTNNDKTPLDLDVYAADGFTSSSGALDLLTRAQKSHDAGTWVHLGRHQLHIRPGATVRVPFTVTVPHGATPGDHSAGIVTSLTTTRAHGMSVERRLGIRLLVRVAGRLIPRLEVDNLNVHYTNHVLGGSGTAVITYSVFNSGNVRLSAGESVHVKGLFGITSTSVSAPAIPELLPGESWPVVVPVTGVKPAVHLTAAVTLHPAVPSDDPGGTPAVASAVTESASVWALPWLLVIALGVLVAAVLVWRTLRHHAKRGEAARVKAAVDEALASRDSAAQGR